MARTSLCESLVLWLNFNFVGSPFFSLNGQVELSETACPKSFCGSVFSSSAHIGSTNHRKFSEALVIKLQWLLRCILHWCFIGQPLHSKSAKALEISIPNKLLKTDCQRAAVLLLVRCGVDGGLFKFRGRLAAT